MTKYTGVYLNQDQGNKWTAAEHDGDKWVSETKSADGDHATLGAQADADSYSGTATVSGKLGGIRGWLSRAIQQLGAAIGTYGALVAGSDGTNARAVKTDEDGHLQVDTLSSALPAGAATSAKQDTLAGLIGEVQASPTENTVLERLKTIETELTDIKSTSGVKKITDAVVLGASTAEIGKLAAGTAEIGAVTISGCIPTDIDKSPLVSLIYLQGGILCRYCVWNHSPKPHGYRSSFRPSD